jgi:hypothetical protein
MLTSVALYLDCKPALVKTKDGLGSKKKVFRRGSGQNCSSLFERGLIIISETRFSRSTSERFVF